MQKNLLILLALFSSAAFADNEAVFVKNAHELALLPSYCRGTQQIRTVSKDPTPIEDYVKIYGKTYLALHHYCWALNSENKARLISDKFLREATLAYALGDIQFTLERATPGFILLPEIQLTRARILFSLHREPEAVLALNKAIEAKSDYVPAYVRLSEYFVDKGDKTNAIKTLEQGIDNTENANFLIKRLAKLGKTYNGVPGNKRETAEAPVEVIPSLPKTNADTATDTGTEKAPAPGTVPEQPADQAAKGPYCRFCP